MQNENLIQTSKVSNTPALKGKGEVFSIQGNLVDVLGKRIYPASIEVENYRIKSITPINQSTNQPINQYILPGFIDSHVHIESSMLVPSEFAKLAVKHGTVATISDPHEIANVCGMEGVQFMINNGKTVNFKFNFGAPSCVPATIFETAGAALNSDDVKSLLQLPEIKYLSEMMNFPGVLYNDEEVMKKIEYALELGKPIDGHAPGLRGEQAKAYIQAAPLPPKGDEEKQADEIQTDFIYETADPMTYGLLKSFVKQHRSNPTQAEMVLWEALKGKKINNHKFRRQHIILNFIADFVCLEKKLIIEVDGLIHQPPENKLSDELRTLELKKLGYSVIRFTNEEVIYEIDKTIEIIIDKLNDLLPIREVSKTPPLGGKGVIISTDHECFTAEEALDKLSYGMKIIIREGSAAKNFEALIHLLHDYEDMILFCSDDKHPDSLVVSHINALCARAVAKGIDIFKILKAACVNPVLHYKLDVGLLQVGDPADFIVCKDLVNFNVTQTYINGELVMNKGESFIKTSPATAINYFDCDTIRVEQLKLHPAYFNKQQKLPVIEVLDGQLITNKIEIDLSQVLKGEFIESNTQIDVLKIVVVNRYNNAPIAFGLVKNVGLKMGALASSVAHDSHNIVAVGVDDESLCQAINLVINAKGGVSTSYFDNGWQNAVLPLPVAGLMSVNDGIDVANTYTNLDNISKQVLGSTLGSPFMSLSFLALLVIPHIKLSDKGLFDGDSFSFITKV